MQDLPLVPYAPILIESMRAVGYSPEAAVADLIDNSITAGADTVHVRFPAGHPDYFAFLDNGKGMASDELLEAMRYGSRNPQEQRAANDLGRFGLGLKTASLSQCRHFTVATVRNGKLSACCWDLDHIIDTENWNIQILEPEDMKTLPLLEELKAQKQGTLVIWKKLDRLTAGDPGDGSVLSHKATLIRQHLSLVFHRFLSGDADRLNILINNSPVVPVDPFLSRYPATQKSPIETIHIGNSDVQVQAFTLPHISRLSRQEIEEAGGQEGLRKQQGFYVYRNKRLIVWGTWFRMFRQEELTKLTRVLVDIPNTLDDEWTIDIRKSIASPPEIVRRRLNLLIPTMCENSRQIQAYRGRILKSGKIRSLWKRIEERDGSIRYAVDRDHPVIEAFGAALDETAGRQLPLLLKAIEESFPTEAFYNDRASERMGYKDQGALSQSQTEQMEYLEELAWQLFESLADKPENRAQLMDSLERLEPFSAWPELTKRIKERVADAA